MKRGVRRGEPGQPALPWRKVSIALPWNATCGTIVSKVGKVLSIADKITVEPLQPNVPTLLGTRVDYAEPNRSLYGSDRIWPSVPARVVAVRHRGRFAVAEIEVCPFRYHLRKRKLELIQQLDLTLPYRESRTKRTKPTSLAELRHEKKLGDRVKAEVINPHDVEGFADLILEDFPAPFSVFPEVDYVIITRSSLAPRFQRLAMWRTTLGLRARVVTVEDILAGTVPDTNGTQFWVTSGYNDGATRDQAEAIRNFCKWASVNWLTDHVLLGGDTEIIPVRQALDLGVGRLPYGDIATSDLRPERQHGHNPSASSEKPGTPAANVIDDDSASAWECDVSDANPWIRLTTSPHTPVNHVELQWGTSFATSYDIQVSPDNTTWTTVHSTNAGAAGIVQVTFACVSSRYVRLVVKSGAVFSLVSMRVFGPPRRDWDGTTYRISDTASHVYLSHYMVPNPTNDLTKNLLVMTDAAHRGLIIPYDPTASDTKLGWRFVIDLLSDPPTVSATSTSFIEIRGPQEYHGNAFGIKDDYNYIPADLYYADVAAGDYPASANHDWDSDNNGIYGEFFGGGLDMVNGRPDVLIGRASVEDPAEVDTFIDKVIRYERFVYRDEFGLESLLPSGFAVAVLLGSGNFANRNTPGVLDGSAASREDIRHMLLNADPARWSFVRLYQDAADVPAADQGADLGTANATNLMDAIRENKNVVALSSHGSSSGMCYLSSSDVDDVVNFSGIWYGNACLTNKIDTTPGEAFGELAALNTVGGAVAYVGNTRFGWTGDGYIEKAFWEEMLESGVLGEMFQAAKFVCHSWEKYSLNLLGDPAMRVFSDRPRTLDVVYDPLIYTGSQDFAVTVNSSGNPIHDATVCLTMPGTLFSKAKTDTAGQAVLSIAPSVVGTMRIAVSGKNLIPYLGSVTVEKGNRICYPAIVCGHNLTCAASIICKNLIGCGPAVACGKAIVCGNAIQCSSLIGGCGPLIGPGCPRLDPDDWDAFKDVFEIWGIRDIEPFLGLAGTPEYEARLSRLPAGMSKAIRQMAERMRTETNAV